MNSIFLSPHTSQKDFNLGEGRRGEGGKERRGIREKMLLNPRLIAAAKPASPL